MRSFPIIGLLALGACAPKWDVVRQAPSLGERPVFVALPIDYGDVEGLPETESFEADREAMDERFREALATCGASGEGEPSALAIAPKALDVELGGWGGKTSELRLLVGIESPEGRLLDVIRVSDRGAPGFSSGERMRFLAGRVGLAVCDYLRERGAR